MPLLVSFEGIDGCGKTTQIGLLGELLHYRGKASKTFREPGGTQASEKIRELLLNQDLALEPLSELLLFSAARAELVQKVLTPLLAAKTLDVIILDRFTDSTLAYQGYGSKIPHVEAITSLTEIVPDLTFYLRLTPDEAAERVKLRVSASKKDRFESRPRSFFEDVVQGYDALASDPGNANRIKVIDATQPQEAISLEIFSHIRTHPKY